MGVWVREGRVIEAGVPLGAYIGRLRMRGALPESAYILPMSMEDGGGRRGGRRCAIIVAHASERLVGPTH